MGNGINLPLPLQLTAVFISDLMTLGFSRFDAASLMMMMPTSLDDQDWTSPFPCSLSFSCSIKQIDQAISSCPLENEVNLKSFWTIFSMVCSYREQMMRKEKHQDNSLFHSGPLFYDTNTTSNSVEDDFFMSTFWILCVFHRELTMDTSKPQAKEDFPSGLVVDLIRKIISRDASTDSFNSKNLIMAACLSRSFLDSHVINDMGVEVILLFFEGVLMERLNQVDDLPESFSLPKNGYEWSSWVSKGSFVGEENTRGLFASLVTLMQYFIHRNLKSSTTEDSLDKCLIQTERLKAKVFSETKMFDDECTPSGLFKFLTILLSFPSSSPQTWMEISDKVCQISQKVFEGKNPSKIAVAFKALFALLYLMSSQSTDLELSENPPSLTSQVKKLLIQQIPHLSSTEESRHPFTVSLDRISLVNFLSSCFDSYPLRCLIPFVLWCHFS